MNSTEHILYNHEIITEAFHNSAKAFSLFVNKKVELEVISINNNYKKIDSIDTKLCVLLSEIKGTLTGKCYLKFNEDDVQKLFLACLPKEYLHNEEMKNGILMELDNILTASVITVFSNKLKVDTYAYVPFLLSIKESEFENLIKKDYENKDSFLINFYSKFQVEELSLNTEFIWLVDAELFKV